MFELDSLIRLSPLTHEDVERFMVKQSLSPIQFFDAFARRVAHEYWASKLDFEIADSAMNSLHSYALFQYDVRLPSYAWEVFLAFDQGEFQHREDGAAVDPEEKYTKPEIRSLVVRDQILGASGEPA